MGIPALMEALVLAVSDTTLAPFWLQASFRGAALLRFRAKDTVFHIFQLESELQGNGSLKTTGVRSPL
jgi:hypothetical protein